MSMNRQSPGSPWRQTVVALLEHDRIEMRGELGEREPVDLGEEREPDEDVLQIGLAREVRQAGHGIRASGSGR